VIVDIYVAGPLTTGDIATNIKKAIDVADKLAKLGHHPFLPHVTFFWQMVHPHDYEFWMQQDFGWLEKCQALFRIKGPSHGSDREVERAKSLNMQIFYDIGEVPKV
jgi:hypothetical protein